MYVAKVNDRGKANYTYMFDDQLFEFGDLLSKSYYMKKSSDLHEIVEFCSEWNKGHEEVLKKNNSIYYFNVALKGLLQAPVLVVLYTGAVIGIMMLFGSLLFHEQIMLAGVAAFGGIVNKIVAAVYIIFAGIGLLVSLSKYDNVVYKAIKSIFSIIGFIAVSPVFFRKVFFSGSEKAILLTVIFLVGCFFVRVLADNLLTGIIRKKTEEIIRAGHDHYMIDAVQGREICGNRGNTAIISGTVVKMQPVIKRLRNNETLKQYVRR